MFQTPSLGVGRGLATQGYLLMCALFHDTPHTHTPTPCTHTFLLAIEKGFLHCWHSVMFLSSTHTLSLIIILSSFMSASFCWELQELQEEDQSL